MPLTTYETWARPPCGRQALTSPFGAVDLDGHGLGAVSPQSRWSTPFDPFAFATEPSPVAAVTASSAAATLVRQLREIGGGDPCVVVAHSMSGPVATAAAELAPELFAHLMYVTAFAPVSGHAAADYIVMPENEGDMVGALLAADPAAVGALRIRAEDRRPQVRECFYNGIDALGGALAWVGDQPTLAPRVDHLFNVIVRAIMTNQAARR